MTFTVYDNKTNRIVVSNAEWNEAENYVDNEDYTVVCNANGMVM